jgi:hypothetical protein
MLRSPIGATMKRKALLQVVLSHISLLQEKHPRKATARVVRQTVHVLSQLRRKAA